MDRDLNHSHEPTVHRFSHENRFAFDFPEALIQFRGELVVGLVGPERVSQAQPLSHIGGADLPDRHLHGFARISTNIKCSRSLRHLDKAVVISGTLSFNSGENQRRDVDVCDFPGTPDAKGVDYKKCDSDGPPKPACG